MNEKFPYDDIVNLPRPISKKHPQPPLSERAARFAPFAAITGYEEMVLEEARVTEERIELDECALALLNEKLNILQNNLSQSPEITVTYFAPDNGATVFHRRRDTCSYTEFNTRTHDRYTGNCFS